MFFKHTPVPTYHVIPSNRQNRYISNPSQFRTRHLHISLLKMIRKFATTTTTTTTTTTNSSLLSFWRHGRKWAWGGGRVYVSPSHLLIYECTFVVSFSISSVHVYWDNAKPNGFTAPQIVWQGRSTNPVYKNQHTESKQHIICEQCPLIILFWYKLYCLHLPFTWPYQEEPG
jgi:hypothetical protein